MPRTVDVWVVWGPNPKKVWDVHQIEDAAVDHRDKLRQAGVNAFVSKGFVSYTMKKLFETRESDQR